jgi:threonine/homoserine/homoserine lactone efflux protein
MSISASLIGIAGAIAVGVVSPGPSFVMVARTAVSKSRAHGLGAALGMGVGGVVFALAALLGLRALLFAVPGVYFVMKIAGGAYLLYLAFRIWRGAGNEPAATHGMDAANSGGVGRSFIVALATQLSNPKTAIIYASVFAAFLPSDVPTYFFAVLPMVIFAIEVGWYSLVAFGLSASAPRLAYLKYKAWIDRTAGAVMGALGIKLISMAHDR